MWPTNINLRFCLLNAENLFLLFDQPPAADKLPADEGQWQRLSTSVYENKSLRKTKDLARAILDVDPDIVMLCEVGGLESLQQFNELFLSKAYSPVLIEGNSDRNIDVGFLIRKGEPFYYDLISNKNRPINYLYPHERESMAQGYPIKAQSHRFSRDVVELKLFQKDRENPFLIILLTHLKSRLDRDRIDPGGFERRQAELLTLLQIHHELRAKHPNTPMVVAGDFNGHAGAAGTDEEFRPLYENTDLRDVLDVAGLSPEQRATFYQVRSGARTEGRQIDYCFLSPLALPYLKKDSARVYRFKDEQGLEHDIPQTLDAKLNLPSDHYPLVFELENLQSW
ncbi:MAG: hypothetical protein KF802_14070 [Bdellovibrionaceae bacterium]|nr:hypothetical protein [Pseudobdellovibrionaceae bacterium]MBX3033156.1 hypothetical protein [Pseudobdellovibrionaceae bacterium]